MATTPTEGQTGYGFMNFYLNTGKRLQPSGPEAVWIHTGAGPNAIYVDPVNDLVIVNRWGTADAEVVRLVLDAMGAAAASAPSDQSGSTRSSAGVAAVR